MPKTKMSHKMPEITYNKSRISRRRVKHFSNNYFYHVEKRNRNKNLRSKQTTANSMAGVERCAVKVDFVAQNTTTRLLSTVLEQVEKYIATKTNTRPSTQAGYKTVINLLKNDHLGKARIDSIRISDAKLWLIKLQNQDGKGYSSIHAIRGVLKPAFQLAVDDDYIAKNPFAFDLSSIIINDREKRECLSYKDEKRFLDFIRTDPHYCKYYEGVYILFKTGLRISEFCGLTIKDIDFQKHSIRIDHQLNKRAGTGYYIQDPKTENGNRIIPMTPDVEECFRKIIENRNPPSKEPTVDGKKGFLFFDKDGHIVYSLHWEHYFKHILKKYNSTHRRKLPPITPHICRHTYCSNMAKSGMNPKILQYLMGHSDISITLNTYTHVKYEDAVAEFRRLKITKRKQSYVKL